MKLTANQIERALKESGLVIECGNIDGKVLSTPLDLLTDTRLLNGVNSGRCFLAYSGVQYDAHDAINVDFLKKISLLILENKAELVSRVRQWSIPYIVVKKGLGRDALAVLAALSYGNPEADLVFIGVTGTNGKTSVAWFLNQLLKQAGMKTLLLGTVGAELLGESFPLAHTTPPPDQLFRLLKDARDKGVSHVVMEVSSHAVAQKRLGPIRFDGVAFTSFSRDHLDFHTSMQEYFDCKWSLLTDYLRNHGSLFISEQVARQLTGYAHESPRNAVIYGDSAKLNTFLNKTTLGYRVVERHKSFCVVDILQCEKPIMENVRLPVVANFALDNILVAIGLFQSMKICQRSDIDPSLLTNAPGRIEPISADKGGSLLPAIYVDYAHTPDAVSAVLKNLRQHCKGKLWALLGCGGDRDQGKRPLMAKAGFDHADVLVLTSDNPRFEDPKMIINSMLEGLPPSSTPSSFDRKQSSVFVEIDREAAIAAVIQRAKPDDIVAILGKGHENYQEIGGTRIEFDDRSMARYYLNMRNLGGS